MKTAVAKNLRQSIIICVEHQNFSKRIRQPCQHPIFGGMPGHPLASITRRHCVHHWITVRKMFIYAILRSKGFFLNKQRITMFKTPFRLNLAN